MFWNVYLHTVRKIDCVKAENGEEALIRAEQKHPQYARSQFSVIRTDKDRFVPYVTRPRNTFVAGSDSPAAQRIAETVFSESGDS